MKALSHENLQLPKKFRVVSQAEMESIEGGLGVAEAIGLILAVGGASYQGGYACGEWTYYNCGEGALADAARSVFYVAALQIGGPVTGNVFMFGFDNGYNSARH